MYLALSVSQSVSAGTKPNPCTVRTHQEKRENSATEEIYNSVLELFICTSDRTT